MPLHICAENHKYWKHAATETMLEQGIWVADLGRSEVSRDRTTVALGGSEYLVVKSAYERTQNVRAGDTLRMVVRGPRGAKAVYEATATGTAEYRIVATHVNDGSFYSNPRVVGARCLKGGMPRPGSGPAGYGGLKDGRAFEVQIPVDGWRLTTLPAEGYTPYATILSI